MRAATFWTFAIIFITASSTLAADPERLSADGMQGENQELILQSAQPQIQMGPWAVDGAGQRGRIHTVLSGDTLWDISAVYLGTPWVWPSVWRDNHDIANPHLILPEDRIWITAGEMRRVTKVEAEKMIAAEQEIAAAPELPEPEKEAVAYLPAQTVPSEVRAETRVRIVERAAMGFLSPEMVKGASSIVGSPAERHWLAEGDEVYLGMGDGEVFLGDQFSIFREIEPVYDVGKRRKLGYHVDILGWLEVVEVEGGSALARVIQSRSALLRGDQIIPRKTMAPEVDIKKSPGALEGAIVFMPDDRTQMGDGDHVYVNRGFLHGFEAGSEVEVYLPGSRRSDKVSGRKVTTPDHIVAQLVLVEVQPKTAVAYVTHTTRSLEVGDRVRPTAQKLAVAR